MKVEKQKEQDGDRLFLRRNQRWEKVKLAHDSVLELDLFF